ncbi:MAG: DUF401 family protein [Firmicutes bacterium]|nr:DUF401 family protein [Bacillota bacterium]
MNQLWTLVMSVVVLIVSVLSKVNLGWSLLLSSGALLIGAGIEPAGIVNIVRGIVTDSYFFELIGINLMINLLEELLKRVAYFERALQILQETFKNRVRITAVFPALFGSIPAFGGAKLSAPLVDLAGKDLNIDPVEKSLLNYWFRHIWEMSSPLFPGVILAIYFSGIGMGKYILLMLPTTLIFTLLGYLFYLRPVLKKNQEALREGAVNGERQGEADSGFGTGSMLWGLLRIVWPVLLIMLVVVVFEISILWPLLLTNLILLYRMRKDKAFFKGLFTKIWSFQMLLMLFGVFMFKTTFEWTGMSQVIPTILAAAGISSIALIIIFPFLIGLLTGMPSAFVGITYPLLLPVFNLGGSLHLGAIMLAFVAGHIGTMLSPLHLCLVLTVDYFRIEIFPFWTRLLYPQIVELLLVLALAFLYGLPG